MEEINSLTVIDSVNLDTIQETMNKIGKMQSIVQATLKKDHDYGVVPGTNKPTLLKPGGEKICMLFGLNPEYEFLQTTEDYEKEFFSYNIKCTLYKSNSPVAQGVGSCNSKEKKYRYATVEKLPERYIGVSEEFEDRYGKTKYRIDNPDICSLVNTILKMAKKRAFIDAVLQVASLSDVFTQDLEDISEFLQEEKEVNMTKEDAGKLKLSFGKYKGETLANILAEDEGYITWLREGEKTDPIIKKACDLLMSKQDETKVTQEQANVLYSLLAEKGYTDDRIGQSLSKYSVNKIEELNTIQYAEILKKIKGE